MSNPDITQILGLHYGDRIRCARSGTEYFVRAVAPGVCVVVADASYPLHDPAPEDELHVLRSPELAHCSLLS